MTAHRDKWEKRTKGEREDAVVGSRSSSEFEDEKKNETSRRIAK